VSPETGGPAAPRVFICYRREDTAAHAGRLCDAMVNRFGKRNVFIDVDLTPGVDFHERITEVVSACQVLIVVMGRNWATVEDDDGTVRIADPEDFVRHECATALARPGVTVVPVLVGGAQMPKRELLPPDLQKIAHRHAHDMSDSRWGYDIDRLNDTLDGLLTDLTRSRETVAPVPTPSAPATPVPAPGPPTPTPTPRDPPSGPPALSNARLILEGMVVAAIAAYVGRWVFNAIPSPDEDAGAIAGVILRRGGTWALTGAALAVWLAIRTGRAGIFRLGLIGLLVGALGGGIGGAVWALPVIIQDPNLDEVNRAAANQIQIGSLAVTGGFIGALIGWLWDRARLGVGLVGGAVAGALTQLVLNGLDWPPSSTAAIVLSFGVIAAAIVGATLAVLATSTRRRLPSTAANPEW